MFYPLGVSCWAQLMFKGQSWDSPSWGISSYIDYLKFFCARNSSLPHLLNHLFILVYICGCFIICVIIQYCVVYFVAQIDPTLATGNSFSLAPVSFQYTPPMWFSVFQLFFFLSKTTRCFRLSFLQPQNQPFWQNLKWIMTFLKFNDRFLHNYWLVFNNHLSLSFEVLE